MPSGKKRKGHKIAYICKPFPRRAVTGTAHYKNYNTLIQGINEK